MLTYLVGFAGLQLPEALVQGAHGLMGGCGLLTEDIDCFPGLLCDRTRLGRDNFNRLLPLLNFEMVTIHQSIATHRWSLCKDGIFATDFPRAPGPRLDQFQVRELAHVLDRVRYRM